MGFLQHANKFISLYLPKACHVDFCGETLLLITNDVFKLRNLVGSTCLGGAVLPFSFFAEI